MLLAYLSLAKPRILMLVVITALASAIVAGQGSISLSLGTLLVLTVGLASAGAAFLNNYWDRDIDALMERTRKRSLPAGKVSPVKAFLVGLTLIAVSLPVALQLNYLVAVFVLAGALIYSILYTLWLKRRTSLNIVIGGLAGSCAILAGWFAITNELSPTPFLIALIVFLWTPSHFWSFALVHQESYQMANIPMLPVVLGVKRTAGYIVLHSVLLMLASIILYFISPLSETYLIGALLLSVLFLASSLWLWKQPSKQWAWLNFKFSGIYLLGLFAFMALDVLI